MSGVEVHPVLDLGTWRSRFDLEAVRREREREVLAEFDSGAAGYDSQSMLQAHLRNAAPRGELVVGPGEIAIIEQLRQELGLAVVESVPVDIFVWAQGRSPDRAMTSVGQLPYWPAARPWPVDSEGQALACAGQLSFVDSAELVDALPGEILVIFLRRDHGGRTDWEHPLPLWVDRDEGSPIEKAPPSGLLPVRPAYGVRHRTVDLVTGELHGKQRDLARSVAIIEGTKVGGLPRWIQRAPKPPPGRFIGCLSSVVPNRWSPYPFLNVESGESIMGEAELDLSWGDAGTAYFFQHGDTTSVIVQYY